MDKVKPSDSGNYKSPFAGAGAYCVGLPHSLLYAVLYTAVIYDCLVNTTG